MARRRLAALAALALMLASCSGSGGAEPGTGVKGIVLLGPSCPVENPASPCPDTPFLGDVQATATDGTIRSTTTDDRGRFTLDLAPGTYRLVALTASGGGPPTAEPETVEVLAGSFTEVTLQVDTGIR
jgi:Carboxypeptidase regulatory-like domain